MNGQEFTKKMVSEGFEAKELDSGKIRFTKGADSYLYTPTDAVRYGTWFNEVKISEERLPV